MKDYYKDENTFIRFEQVESYQLDNYELLARMDGTVLKHGKPRELHVLYVNFYSGNTAEIKGDAIDACLAEFNEWLESDSAEICANIGEFES